MAENIQHQAVTDDDTVTIEFKVEINMAQYAKRFGIDIPDDTIDAELTDDSPSSQTTDAAPSELVPAEDATVTYGGNAPAGAANCKATLAQCQAKNPLTCRFHGAKAIAQDIEAQVRAQNVPGKVSVDILNVNSKGILTAQVTVKGSKADKNAILAGLQNFAKLPGVESADIFQRGGGGYEEMFDIDTLDPQAQARWGMGQSAPTPNPAPAPAPKPAPAPAAPQPKPAAAPKTQPAPAPKPAPAPQPQPAPKPQVAKSANPSGNRLHPKPPPDQTPPPPPPFTQQDIDDLVAARDRLEPVARLLNGRVGDIPKLQSSSRWQSLDGLPGDTAFYKRLDDLAKNKDSVIAQAAKDLKQVADNIASSKKNNWTTSAGMVEDKATFDGKLPTPQTVPEIPKTEEQKRGEFISSAKSQIKSADKNDKPMLDAAVADMEAAQKDMTDLENNIAMLDDALSKATDQDEKAALQAVVDAVDSVYADLDSKYKNARKVFSDWSAKQSVVSDAFGYDEAKAFYTSRGLDVPVGLQNMESHAAKKEAAAEKVVERALSGRKGWKTHQERLDRIAQLRKNLQELWKHIHIYRAGSTYCDQSLAKDGAVRASMDGDYQRAMRNAFGVPSSYSLKPSDMQLYCYLSVEDNPKNSGDYCAGHARVIELDPKKAIGGILFTRGCGYWSGGSTTAMSLVSRISFTDLAYEGSMTPKFRPESAEVDFTGMTPKQMFKTMFGGPGTMEFHPVNGASFEQENIKKVWCNKNARMSAGASSACAKHGVEIETY